MTISVDTVSFLDEADGSWRLSRNDEDGDELLEGFYRLTDNDRGETVIVTRQALEAALAAVKKMEAIGDNSGG